MIVALPGLFSYLFYCIKVGFKGSKLYRHVLVMRTVSLRKGFLCILLQKCFQTDALFSYQGAVSAIKFRKRLTKLK